MQKNSTYRLLSYLLPLFALSCVDPYTPPEIADSEELLVVDGMLNATTKTARVTLGYSKKLLDKSSGAPEPFADVYLEDDNGNRVLLPSQNSGVYEAGALDISFQRKYRLSITTSRNENYLSDFISLVQTPAIDSLVWRPSNEGVAIQINTHDSEGLAKYFKWEYVETWQYHAAFNSDYKVVNGTAVYRTTDELVYNCWRSRQSERILISSTAQLSQNRITNYELTFLPKQTEKPAVGYSLLVNQRAISKEEFTYWELLRKTSESIGGMFDPMPSQIEGNIHHATDPQKMVLGYFSGGSVVQQRVMFKSPDLPVHLQLVPLPPADCVEEQIAVNEVPQLSADKRILTGVYMGIFLIGYKTARATCADCTLAGGISIKPDFWD